MSETSTQERISHVVRRLGIGAGSKLVSQSGSVTDAIALSLSPSRSGAVPPTIDPPPDAETAIQDRAIGQTILSYWAKEMANPAQPIAERLVWFWNDHFATSVRKVKFGYLMWRQHLTIRRHATGSFADLLFAMVTDPAMLIYLDGRTNRRDAVNENFAREVMELHTTGPGPYTQDDVVEAARAFTGWVVAVPGRRALPVDPWTSTFVPYRHDGGSKTVLGVTGQHDAESVVTILLERPETARHIATKLYTELVGLPPTPDTARRLATAFAAEYSVMDLVTDIIDDPAFISDEAIRSRVRTPLERGITVLQSFDVHDRAHQVLAGAMRTANYLPLNPPNPAGFSQGPRLLGPHSLVHNFDFAAMIDPRSLRPATATERLASIGVFDSSVATRAALDRTDDPWTQTALALNSPEFALT